MYLAPQHLPAFAFNFSRILRACSSVSVFAGGAHTSRLPASCHGYPSPHRTILGGCRQGPGRPHLPAWSNSSACTAGTSLRQRRPNQHATRAAWHHPQPRRSMLRFATLDRSTVRLVRRLRRGKCSDRHWSEGRDAMRIAFQAFKTRDRKELPPYSVLPVGVITRRGWIKVQAGA